MYFNLPRNTTVYKQAGTETFRASSVSLLGEWGTNLQNVPKHLRSMYWADDGYVMCQVDQSGAEALIVSYLCEKANYRDLFLHNVKPHVFVALHVFQDIWKTLCKNMDIEQFLKAKIHELKTLPNWETLDGIIQSSDDWAANERYYYIAKMICHAANYGMRGSAFQMNVLEKSEGSIVLTKLQAEGYLTQYHGLFPEIHGWHREVEECYKATKRLYNLFQQPREFTQKVSEYDFKDMYAFIPQSTVGVITHRAITNLQEFVDINNRDWHILGNCHDSYLAEAPIGQEVELATTMKSLMEQSLTNFRGEQFKMKSEVQVGRNWGTKKSSNPDGLDKVKL